MNKFDFKAQELEPVIRETIESNGSFRLFPKGNSMLPFIREEKDSVLLRSPDDLKKYDIVLYKRPGGQYVIHRIMRVLKDSLVLCGDNQFVWEKNISKDSVIAKVGGIYREEKLINAENFGYKCQVVFWVGTRHIRRIWRGVRGRIKKYLILKDK